MKNIACFASIHSNNDLWISHLRFNGLYKADLCSNNVEKIADFPNIDVGADGLHYCGKKYGDKLYFFPQKSRGIDIYDLSTGEFSQVEIPLGDNKYGRTIIDVYEYDDTAVLLPRFKGMPIIIFSMNKGEIIDTLQLLEANKYGSEDTNDLILYSCKVDDKIYYPIRNKNCIGSYDIKKREEKIYILDGINKMMGDIEYDGSYFWMNSDDGIYRWKLECNSLERICDCRDIRQSWIEHFILYENKMICIPRWLGDIKIINIKTLEKEIIPIKVSELHGNIDTPWRDIKDCFVWGQRLVILPVRYGETIFVDLDTHKISYTRHISKESMDLLGKISIQEENSEDFGEYIGGILYNKCNNLKYKNTNGKDIWDVLNSSK